MQHFPQKSNQCWDQKTQPNQSINALMEELINTLNYPTVWHDTMSHVCSFFTEAAKWNESTWCHCAAGTFSDLNKCVFITCSVLTLITPIRWDQFTVILSIIGSLMQAATSLWLLLRFSISILSDWLLLKFKEGTDQLNLKDWSIEWCRSPGYAEF